jgi:hypothetical protein
MIPEGTIKRFICCIAVILVLAASAYAETGSQQSPGDQEKAGGAHQMQMMQCPKMQQMQAGGGGQQMPMMQMCPMMHQMMGQGMMMKDMSRMMMDMMNIQEKIIHGVKASEKKELLKKLQDMKSGMQDMMRPCKCMVDTGMMGHPAPPPAPECESRDIQQGKPQSGEPQKADPHKH